MTHEACRKCAQEEKDKLQQVVPVTDDGAAAAAAPQLEPAPKTFQKLFRNFPKTFENF